MGSTRPKPLTGSRRKQAGNGRNNLRNRKPTPAIETALGFCVIDGRPFFSIAESRPCGPYRICSRCGAFRAGTVGTSADLGSPGPDVYVSAVRSSRLPAASDGVKAKYRVQSAASQSDVLTCASFIEVFRAAYASIVEPHLSTLWRRRSTQRAEGWGEITPVGLDAMLEQCPLGRGDVLVDVGCGVGSAMLWASMKTGCSSVGLEVVTSRASIGRRFLADAIGRATEAGLAIPQVTVAPGDIKDPPATFVHALSQAALIVRADAVLLSQPDGPSSATISYGTRTLTCLLPRSLRSAESAAAGHASSLSRACRRAADARHDRILVCRFRSTSCYLPDRSHGLPPAGLPSCTLCNSSPLLVSGLGHGDLCLIGAVLHWAAPQQRRRLLDQGCASATPAAAGSGL